MYDCLYQLVQKRDEKVFVKRTEYGFLFRIDTAEDGTIHEWSKPSPLDGKHFSINDIVEDNKYDLADVANDERKFSRKLNAIMDHYVQVEVKTAGIDAGSYMSKNIEFYNILRKDLVHTDEQSTPVTE